VPKLNVSMQKLVFLSIGLSYTAGFSLIHLHPMVKLQLFCLPIQLGIVVYMLWFRPRNKPYQSALEAPAKEHQ